MCVGQVLDITLRVGVLCSVLFRKQNVKYLTIQTHDRSMDQAISQRLINAETWLRYQAGPSNVLVDTVAMGHVFL
jgi:hypothetical protein